MIFPAKPTKIMIFGAPQTLGSLFYLTDLEQIQADLVIFRDRPLAFTLFSQRSRKFIFPQYLYRGSTTGGSGAKTAGNLFTFFEKKT